MCPRRMPSSTTSTATAGACEGRARFRSRTSWRAGWGWSLACFVAASAGWAGTAPHLGAPPPATGPDAIRFGLVADVQYADKDAAGTRRYRDSLESLRDCVWHW